MIREPYVAAGIEREPLPTSEPIEPAGTTSVPPVVVIQTSPGQWQIIETSSGEAAPVPAAQVTNPMVDFNRWRASLDPTKVQPVTVPYSGNVNPLGSTAENPLPVSSPGDYIPPLDIQPTEFDRFSIPSPPVRSVGPGTVSDYLPVYQNPNPTAPQTVNALGLQRYSGASTMPYATETTTPTSGTGGTLAFIGALALVAFMVFRGK